MTSCCAEDCPKCHPAQASAEAEFVPECKFKVGDIVMLKSGSGLMTVINTSYDDEEKKWFVGLAWGDETNGIVTFGATGSVDWDHEPVGIDQNALTANK